MLSYPLAASLSALLIAQLLKFLITFVLDRRPDFSRLISTGGMPSSHTALTAALTTAFGVKYGIHSPFFAIAAIVTIVVAHDAAGLCWQAGQHASEINKIRDDLQKLFNSISGNEHIDEHRDQLKELLGHKPLEVFMGALLGISVAYILR